MDFIGDLHEQDFVSEHASDLLKKLESDRQNAQELCDLTVKASDQDFRVHKCIFAAFSNIETKCLVNITLTRNGVDPLICFPRVDANTMEVILNYLYTCKISISGDNVVKLLDAADETKIPSVRNCCDEFLCGAVNSKNCIDMRKFATRRNLQKLTEMTENRFIQENFELMLNDDQFQEMPKKTLLELLKLRDEKTTSEEEVFRAIIRWIAFEQPEREQHFSELFELINLENLSPDFLESDVVDEEMVMKNTSCLRGVVEVLANRATHQDETEMTDPQSENCYYPRASLYVGDLHRSIDEEDICDAFERFGSISSVLLCRFEESGDSRGFGFVTFEKTEEAKTALSEMKIGQINGKDLHVTWSQDDPSMKKSDLGCIYVKDLPPSFTNKNLFDLFGVFGNVLSCKIKSWGKESSRNGFVHFECEDDAQRAIEVADNLAIGDSTISVEKFKTKAERARENDEKGNLFTNLYVKNFGSKLNEEELWEMFSEYGELMNVSIQSDDKGNSLGFGFVNFKGHEDAVKAIEALNGYKIKGTKTLFVGRALSKQERKEELGNQPQQLQAQQNNLYIKNIDGCVSENELEEAFSVYGNITSILIKSDKKNRRYGFVCFKNEQSAKQAVIDMNGFVMGSKPLYVSFARKKDDTRKSSSQAPSSSLQATRPQRKTQCRRPR